MKSVHIAMDKFRDCFTQSEISDLLKGILTSQFSSVSTYLIADGGEGSLDVFRSLNWSQIQIKTAGPMGEPCTAHIMQSPDLQTIAIELAEIAGKKHMKSGASAWNATSYGLGLALLEALKLKPLTIVICLGGSASSDGGLGIFQGLEIQVLDQGGKSVGSGVAGIADAFSINKSQLVEIQEKFSLVQFKVLVDTSAKLIGKPNAIWMYGKQKGLTFIQQTICYQYFRKWSQLLVTINPTFDPTGFGSGAAGGCTSALQAIFNAQIISGSQYFFMESGLATAISADDIVITGEGKVDASTLTNKAIMPVINCAIAMKAHLVIITGVIDPSAKIKIEKIAPSVQIFEISSFAPTLEHSLKHASKIISDNLLVELELIN